MLAICIVVAQERPPYPAPNAGIGTQAGRTLTTLKPGDSMPIEPADPAKVVTTPTGLKYVDLVEGTGLVPRKGQKLTVDYLGRLEDGTVFDTSTSRKKPFVYYHQLTQLIAGWTEGVSTMKVGGKRRLIVPARLGYGSEGAGDKIPPNATLVFDIELLKVEDVQP
jgi:peptidylprolyl isomerase